MFLPGSQISDKPLKDISHLMNEPQKFALIKLDKVRGNACVSRREIISSFKKEDKAKIIEKYKVGDIIKGAEVKGYSTFGCFFNVNGELDVLVHLQEISYSRVNHPDEVFNIGEKHDLKVISVDKEKLQVGCSVKQLSPDPFEHIDKIYIEDSLSGFMRGRTSQQTIVKLAKFNAVLVYCLEFAYGEIVKGVNPMTARKKLFGKSRVKGKSAKDFVKEEINCLYSLDEYVKLTPTGLWDKRNMDSYDALVCALYE